MPVFGRRKLLPHTIERLIDKNGLYAVICSGHDEEDKKICMRAGAEWIYAANSPLGYKWNAAFIEAKKYDPDGILFVGSSDWVEDDYLDKVRPFMDGHSVVGVRGFYLCDIQDGDTIRYQTLYWGGYHDSRKDEPIGIGRVLTRGFLEEIKYRPFDDNIDMGLDYSMWVRATRSAYPTKVLDDRLRVLSISSNRWHNKHAFKGHEKAPDDLLSYFPEVYEIFK